MPNLARRLGSAVALIALGATGMLLAPPAVSAAPPTPGWTPLQAPAPSNSHGVHADPQLAIEAPERIC